MELWDLYNADGSKTGNVVKRGDYIEDGYYHLAVELWIVNSNYQILIQKRSENKKTLPNIWGMTTGCIVSGEESLEGAIREAKEEIGIDISKEEIKKFRSMVHGDTLWNVYLVEKEYDISKATLQKEEVSDIKWVSTNEIRQMLIDGLFFEYPEIYELLSVIESKDLDVKCNSFKKRM